MFKDEYECAGTCIFATKAESQDYHALGAVENIENGTFIDSRENTYPDFNFTEPNGTISALPTTNIIMTDTTNATTDTTDARRTTDNNTGTTDSTTT